MCVKLMCTTQLKKFGSAIGTHSRQMSSASYDGAMETFPDISVVDSCFGTCLDDFYNFSGQAAPISRSIYQVVNALTLKFVLSTKLRFIPVFWVVEEGGSWRSRGTRIIRSTLSIPNTLIIPLLICLYLRAVKGGRFGAPDAACVCTVLCACCLLSPMGAILAAGETFVLAVIASILLKEKKVFLMTIPSFITPLLMAAIYVKLG